MNYGKQIFCQFFFIFFYVFTWEYVFNLVNDGKHWTESISNNNNKECVLMMIFPFSFLNFFFATKINEKKLCKKLCCLVKYKQIYLSSWWFCNCKYAEYCARASSWHFFFNSLIFCRSCSITWEPILNEKWELQKKHFVFI